MPVLDNGSRYLIFFIIALNLTKNSRNSFAYSFSGFIDVRSIKAILCLCDKMVKSDATANE
jgi:hypothetical protein